MLGSMHGSQQDLFLEMQFALDEIRRENEDLKVNLSLNKESLKDMIKEQALAATKEASLIETIKIISMENTKLSMEIDSLKMKMISKTTMVDRDAQVDTV